MVKGLITAGHILNNIHRIKIRCKISVDKLHLYIILYFIISENECQNKDYGIRRTLYDVIAFYNDLFIKDYSTITDVIYQ